MVRGLEPGKWYFTVSAHKDAFVECWTLSNEAVVELERQDIRCRTVPRTGSNTPWSPSAGFEWASPVPDHRFPALVTGY